MRKNIMLCSPFEIERITETGLRKRTWNTDLVLTQPKLDGERCRALFDGKCWTMFSSESLIKNSCPHILEQLNNLSVPAGTHFDGELYCHGIEQNEIHSMVSRTENLHDFFDLVNYHIFDLISSEPQLIRLAKLNQMDVFHENLKLVETKAITEFSKLYDVYDSYLAEGYEGAIFRHPDAPYVAKRNLYIMKFKPKGKDIYIITGWNEEHSMEGNPKGRIGSLSLTSDEGTVFNVAGISDIDKKLWWERREELIGLPCEVSYQTKKKNGIPKFAVKPKVLFDIKTKTIEENPFF